VTSTPLLELEPPGRESESRGLVSVPRSFVALAERVARHGAADRWALLYRLLWRIVHGERELLDHQVDPDVARAFALSREVDSAVAVEQPAAPSTAVAFVPDEPTLPSLREAAKRCTACPLHEKATQTVFGTGPVEARVIFIGEQPGDQEDRQGMPFVGPAGEVLDRALKEVGLARQDIYITNVVKHFKFEQRGKRRLHQTPQPPEIAACRPWLETEIAIVKPLLIVCLGATAAQALLGPGFRVLKNRGRMFETRWAPSLMVTVHPSSILRVEDSAGQERAYADLVADLRTAAERLQTIERGTADVAATSREPHPRQRG
jgi:uracil-DNA glycosylase family protein